MRRIAALALVLAGCFNEAPDTKTASSSATTAAPDDESSSSSDAEESSSSDGESSSSTGNPYECPEWCNACDLISGYNRCRCVSDDECEDDLMCEGFVPEPYTLGHCR